jgi:hypothetical protein
VLTKLACATKTGALHGYTLATNQLGACSIFMPLT